MIQNTNDLFEMILRYNDGDIKETILDVNEVIAMIGSNPNKFIHRLNEKLTNFAEDEGLCELCGTELEYNLEYEDAGEYMGEEIKQPFYTNICMNPDCEKYMED